MLVPKQEPHTDSAAGKWLLGIVVEVKQLSGYGIRAHKGTDVSYLSNSLNCHSLERSSGWLHLAEPISQNFEEALKLPLLDLKITSKMEYAIYSGSTPSLLCVHAATVDATIPVCMHDSLCARSIIHSFVCSHIIIAMRSA